MLLLLNTCSYDFYVIIVADAIGLEVLQEDLEFFKAIASCTTHYISQGNSPCLEIVQAHDQLIQMFMKFLKIFEIPCVFFQELLVELSPDP